MKRHICECLISFILEEQKELFKKALLSGGILDDYVECNHSSTLIAIRLSVFLAELNMASLCRMNQYAQCKDWIERLFLFCWVNV